MAKTLLEAKKIWYKYPRTDRWVLKDLDIALEKHKIILVTGPNGAGKTTLILILAGLLEPQKGKVLLHGEPLKEQLPGARRYIGVLFQNPETMLFNPIVYDEIAFAPRQLFDEEAVKKKIHIVLEQLGLNKEYLNKHTFKLSYGEKKLIAIASIISYDPEILLLDEPLTNLSRKYKDKILELIRNWREQGKAILIASHDVEEYTNIYDSCYILKYGKLIENRRSLQE
ncbi:MAG: ABC transporter ATP-binding protein [Staphylothermus sp.]|nr:ABC transporter ATP-binding protein [Staphylothermus sp.]